MPSPTHRPVLASLALAAGLLGAPAASAQWDLGVVGGGTGYEGELAPTDRRDHLELARPTAGLFARYQFMRSTAVRMSYQWARLNGTDRGRGSSESRNYRFRNDVHEIHAMVEFYPLTAERYVAWYLTFGGAFYLHDPTTDFAGNGSIPAGRYSLRELGTEGQGIEGFGERYSRTGLAVPMGTGLRFRLGERFLLGTEFLVRVTGTDYLDDLSARRYVPEDILAANGPLAVELAYRTDEIVGLTDPALRSPDETIVRANPETNDFYWSLQATFSYQFGNPRPLPKPKNSRRRGPIPCVRF